MTYKQSISNSGEKGWLLDLKQSRTEITFLVVTILLLGFWLPTFADVTSPSTNGTNGLLGTNTTFVQPANSSAGTTTPPLGVGNVSGSKPDSPSNSPSAEKEKILLDKVIAIATASATIISIFAAIAAAFSAYFSYLSVKQAEQATRIAQATADQAEISAKAQRLSDLWPDMHKLCFLSETEMKELDDPKVAEKIRKEVNTMEKLSLWWHYNLVDRSVMEAELGEGFIQLYDQIFSLGKIPPLDRTSDDLLEENPLLPELYAAVKQSVGKISNPKTANQTKTNQA